MKQICETLKHLRKKNGYTQQKLADFLDLEVSSYGKKELGQSEITLTQLESLSNFYDMTVIELLAYPKEIHIVGEPLKPKVSIVIDVFSDNQGKTVAEVLEKIEGINLMKNKK
jgi:transcriptional regulator with XRE-family HTH domain